MQAVPPADTPLDEIPHPLLAKAAERFADEATPRERIASVDDHVLFKVKVQRWRGAVWMADDGIPWLVAAGQREEGSPDDFYALLTARGKAARSQYNAARTPPLTTERTPAASSPGGRTNCAGRPSTRYEQNAACAQPSTPCCANHF
jgi:hypothetical protein